MEPKLGDMYIDHCDNLCYFVHNGDKWVKRFYDNINDDNYFMDLVHRIDDIDKLRERIKEAILMREDSIDVEEDYLGLELLAIY